MHVDAAEILQRIHDSEIDFALATFGPDGIDWRVLDDEMNAVAGGSADSLFEAAVAIAEAAFLAFPESDFAAWWRPRRPQGPQPPSLRDPCPLCGIPVKAMASHGDVWRIEHTEGGPCRGLRGLQKWEPLPIAAIWSPAAEACVGRGSSSPRSGRS